jgi:hypothetical protein
VVQNLAKSRLLQCCGSNGGWQSTGLCRGVVEATRGRSRFPTATPRPAGWKLDKTVFNANFTLRKLRYMAHLPKLNWQTRMLNGLSIKLLDFPSDRLPVPPLGERALHPRVIRLASLIVVSLVALALSTVIWGAVYLLNVR